MPKVTKLIAKLLLFCAYWTGMQHFGYNLGSRVQLLCFQAEISSELTPKIHSPWQIHGSSFKNKNKKIYDFTLINRIQHERVATNISSVNNSMSNKNHWNTFLESGRFGFRLPPF